MSQLHVVPLHRRTVAALSAVSLVGVIAFFWPFFVSPQSVAADHATDAPWFFAILLPLVVGVLLAEISDDGLDAKGVAMLAVLAAVATAVRPLGAGVAGLTAAAPEQSRAPQSTWKPAATTPNGFYLQYRVSKIQSP